MWFNRSVRRVLRVITPATLAIVFSLLAWPARAQTRDAVLPPAQVAASQAEGKEIRLTMHDRSHRTGTLMSISASEIVLRRDGHDVRLPRSEAVALELVSHRVRNWTLAGAAGGFVAGLPLSCRSADCFYWYESGALFAGIGAGAGAVIGAIVNAATADRRQVSLAPTPSTTVTPLIAPGRAGVSVRVRW